LVVENEIRRCVGWRGGIYVCVCEWKEREGGEGALRRCGMGCVSRDVTQEKKRQRQEEAQGGDRHGDTRQTERESHRYRQCIHAHEKKRQTRSVRKVCYWVCKRGDGATASDSSAVVTTDARLNIMKITSSTAGALRE
jgi:hypothetical protein